MKIKTLQQQHPEYDGDLWRDYEALYAGGDQFRKRINRFLARNPQEPEEIYSKRKREAVYRSYLGTVVDYFTALLFSVPVIYKPTVGDSSNEVDLPEWVEDLADNVDGCGSDLSDFLRASLIEACVKRKSYWLIDYPDNYGQHKTLVDAERDGALDVRLRIVKRDNILDYRRDKRGNLLWAIIVDEETVRDEPEDIREHKITTWTVVDKQRIRKFEAITHLMSSPDSEIVLTPISDIPHGLGEMPLIELDVHDGLWVANRLESPQLEHFRLTAANNWSMRRTAYAMPVLNLLDPEGFNPQRMGAGYFLKLGLEEKASWIAPPSAHFAAMTEEVRNQKDEIFRLVTQMSLGVDNNAAAIGRSAESKMADAEAIQVVLRAYANKIRDALKTALNRLSKSRGEQHEWHVEGLDRFETIPPDMLIELLKASLEIGVPSKTFKVEAKFRAASALLPGIDSTTREKIREEITAGVDEEEENDAELLEIARGTGAGAQRGPEEDPSGGSAAAPIAPPGSQKGVAGQGRPKAG